MSGSIWGIPLIAGVSLDEAIENKHLADLRNWDQLYVRDKPVDIVYEQSSRTNFFSYEMLYHANEAFVYEFPVEPNTNYSFYARIYGDFTEENNDYDHVTIAVCTDMPQNTGLINQSDIILAERVVNPGRRQNYLQRFNSGDLTSVYLVIHMAGATDGEVATFEIDNLACMKDLNIGDPIWAQKPRWINGYDDDSVNMMAVSSEGAWVYSCIDQSRTHHLYFLSGNEFKVLVFLTDTVTGFINKQEFYSTPIVVQGETYHACHANWPNVSWVDIWTSEYVEDEPSDDTIAKRLSDDEIYLKLSRWVREEEPYDIGDLYSKDMLKSYLKLDDSAIDDMFKDYTVDEHGLNYLSGD